MAPIAPSASGPSRPGAVNNPWLLAEAATRLADAQQKPVATDCGQPVVNDPALSEHERELQATRQVEQQLQQVARQLLRAPDELGQLTGAALMNDRAAMVRTALGTRDPVVYGLALSACNDGPQMPACQVLSPQQWAQLDPSNAAAWWAIAAASRDQSAALAAMQRASAAPKVVPLNGQMLRRAAALPGMTPEQLLPIVSLTTGMDASVGLTVSAGLSAACGRTPQADAERNRLCQHLALATLRQQSSALGKLSLTLKAERLGVTAEQLPQSKAALKQLMHDIHTARLSSFLRDDGVLSCDEVGQMVAFDVDAVEDGDIAAYSRLQQRREASTANAASAMTAPTP